MTEPIESWRHQGKAVIGVSYNAEYTDAKDRVFHIFKCFCVFCNEEINRDEITVFNLDELACNKDGCKVMFTLGG